MISSKKTTFGGDFYSLLGIVKLYFLLFPSLFLSLVITAQPVRPLMRDFIGINARVHDDIRFVDKFNTIHEYHFWSGDTGFDTDKNANCSPRKLRFNNSYNEASLDNFDAFYLQLSNRVIPTMKWLAPEMRGLTTYQPNMLEQKPLCVDGISGYQGNNFLSSAEAANFFKIGACVRTVSRENLEDSARFFKNYIHIHPAANGNYSVAVQLFFPQSTTTRKLKVWLDTNGDGVFDNATETLYLSPNALPYGFSTETVSIPALPTTLPNRLIKMRLAAVNHGDAEILGSFWGGSTVFTWDLLLLTNHGAIKIPDSEAPIPAAVGNSGRITEVAAFKNTTKVYGKKLRDAQASLDYNFFNDAPIVLLYKSAAARIDYTIGADLFDDWGSSADLQLDRNLNGAFAANELFSFPTKKVLPAPTSSGLTALRITHKNNNNQPLGTWEYLTFVQGNDSIFPAVVSPLLTNTVFQTPIIPNSGPSQVAEHRVLLPINQEAPESYLQYARWASAVAARYGQTTVCNNTALCRCHFLQNMVDSSDNAGNAASGLRRIQWIEMGNEPDQWWRDSEFRNRPEAVFQFTPKQYAALLTGAYDGAGRSTKFRLAGGCTTPTYLGVRNLDPKIKVAMGGISDFRGRWLTELFTECAAMRPTSARKIPFDALNIHHYASENTAIGADYIGLPGDQNPLWQNFDYNGLPGPKGRSPEDIGLRARYEQFFHRLVEETTDPALRNELTGTMEYWLSEFGYDSNVLSGVRAEVAGQSDYTTQAQWLVRSYLELSAVAYEASNGDSMVVNKAMMFDVRDEIPYENAQNPGSSMGYLFDHSGLVTRDYRPKRSWYQVQTLRSVLGTSRFVADINANRQFFFENPPMAAAGDTIYPRVFLYQRTDGKYILSVWSPSAQVAQGLNLYLDNELLQTAIEETTGTTRTISSQFTLITPRDLSERGTYKGFSIQNHPQYVLPVRLDASTTQVSETPMYVLLDTLISDPALTCTMGIPAVTSFCDGALIDWSAANTPDVGFWKTVVVKKSDLPSGFNCSPTAAAALDLLSDNRVRIVTDKLPSARKNLLLHGLDSNTDYVALFFYQRNSGVLQKTPCVVCFTTNGQAPCQFEPCVSAAASTQSGGCSGGVSSDWQNLLHQPTDNPTCTGSINSGDLGTLQTCLNYTQPDINALNAQLWTSCDPYEVEVLFETPVRLSAIKFWHSYGSDDVEIYYTCCACTTKQLLTTWRPHSKTNHWVTISDDLPNLPVSKLFFRKIGRRGYSQSTEIKIGHLHFCGEEDDSCLPTPNPLAENEPTQNRSNDPNAGIFEDIWVEKQENGGADVFWKPVDLFADFPLAGQYREYEVYAAKRSNPNLPANFSRIKPQKVPYHPQLDVARIHFPELTNGNTYDVLVRVAKTDLPCTFGAKKADYFSQSHIHGLDNQTMADTVLTFVMGDKLSEKIEDSSPIEDREREQQRSFVDIFPNPSSGQVTLSWSASGFTLCELFDTRGLLLRSIGLENTQHSLSMDLKNLPAGLYALRLSGFDQESDVRIFVKTD